MMHGDVSIMFRVTLHFFGSLTNVLIRIDFMVLSNAYTFAEHRPGFVA